MKTLFVTFLILLAPTLLLAQGTEQLELDPSFNAIYDFFLPGVIGAALVLASDAKKYILSGAWSWSVFFKTKALPFILTVVFAVVIYLVLAYVPIARPFIEIFTGYELVEITSAALMGAAAAIINGVIKPTVDPALPKEAQRSY